MAHNNQVAVVADENALCGAGLLHMVQACLTFSKVLTCRNFRELAGILGQYRTRVGLAVVDYGLPGMRQTDGLKRLCDAWPSIPILVTADVGDRDTILEVLSAGSHGFIPKSSSPLEMENALKATAGGQVFVSQIPAERGGSASLQAKRPNDWHLTTRQKEVLDLLAAGKSNKQIASTLGISEGTVKVHVNATFRALGVQNRVNATRAFLELS